MRLASISGQRKLMLWFYNEPTNDPYVSLNFDVNIEPALAFLKDYEGRHGVHVGLHHLVTHAVVGCVRDMPALNVRILRRRIYALDRVNVAMPVHLRSPQGSRRDETGMMIVRDAHTKSLAEIAEATRRGASVEREGDKQGSLMSLGRRFVGALPQAAAERLLDMAGSVLNSPLPVRAIGPWLGVSTAVTNVGAVTAMPEGAHFRAASATLPTKLGQVASAFAIAPIEEVPVVLGGQVVVRKVLPIVLIVDHRAIDGYLMAKAAESLVTRLLDPERFAAGA